MLDSKRYFLRTVRGLLPCWRQRRGWGEVLVRIPQGAPIQRRRNVCIVCMSFLSLPDAWGEVPVKTCMEATPSARALRAAPGSSFSEHALCSPVNCATLDSALLHPLQGDDSNPN